MIKRGSQLSWSKLDEHDARNIRELVAMREDYYVKARNLSNRKLAEKYGVHERTIDKLVSGLTWSHVKLLRIQNENIKG